MSADRQNQSLDTNLFHIQNESLSDVTSVSFNGSNKIICPTNLEEQGQSVNWSMVAKGIALSMGQGIVK